MRLIFLNDCAVDGCYKRNVKGKQMCKEHQKMYDMGHRLIAFYGKVVQKQNLRKPKYERNPQL
jgi:hemerythrin superfamily protein